jgi:hypothetical protein
MKVKRIMKLGELPDRITITVTAQGRPILGALTSHVHNAIREALNKMMTDLELPLHDRHNNPSSTYWMDWDGIDLVSLDFVDKAGICRAVATYGPTVNNVRAFRKFLAGRRDYAILTFKVQSAALVNENALTRPVRLL